MTYLRLVKRKNQYGEYIIRCYVNGKHYPDGDYFTDDWEDAINTLKFEAKRHKTTVQEQIEMFGPFTKHLELGVVY